MRQVTINLPEAGAMPHQYVIALVQEISEHTMRGDMEAANAIAGLLAITSVGVAYAVPIRPLVFELR